MDLRSELSRRGLPRARDDSSLERMRELLRRSDERWAKSASVHEFVEEKRMLLKARSMYAPLPADATAELELFTKCDLVHEALFLELQLYSPRGLDSLVRCLGVQVPDKQRNSTGRRA